VHLSFSLENPYRSTNYAKTIFYRNKRLSENKTFEIQFARFQAWYIINFELEIKFSGKDHAGPRLEIEIFSWFFEIKIYDNRHWNYDLYKWEE